MPTFFGTDGIRGCAANSPFLKTDFLQRLGIALCTWAKGKSGAHQPTFVIGTDTRSSGKKIAQSLAQGIIHTGGACLDAGILPTPALHSLVTNHPAHYHVGIMITASHNKPTDNGIKVAIPAGKISGEDQTIIEELINQLPSPHLPEAAFTQIPHHHQTGYAQNLLKSFPPRMLAGLHIILDCAHGATYVIAPAIFKHYGATLTVIGNEPNGENSNTGCGSTAPQKLKTLVLALKADMGFAFDGDGDRVCVINQAGNLLSGEEVLSLASTHPRFATERAVVGTIVANSGLEQWLRQQGKELIKTDVGDAQVHAAMLAHNAELGGEPSGHLIVQSHLPTADGIYAALLVAHTLLETKNSVLTTFKPIPSCSLSLPVQIKRILTEEPFASIIRAHEQALVPGRCLIRYSGTEPVLRLLVEHPDPHKADHALKALAEQLKPYLGEAR